MLYNYDITSLISFILGRLVTWLESFSFTFNGVTVTLSQWWYLCIGFAIVIKFLSWLAGTELLGNFFSGGGVKSD